MGHNVFSNKMSKPWHQVSMSPCEDYVSPRKARPARHHPLYDDALEWCQGPMITGRFKSAYSGNFRFENAIDALHFKLAWA